MSNTYGIVFSRLMIKDRFEQLRKMVRFSDLENKDPMDTASEN